MTRRRADDQPRTADDGPTTRYGRRSGSGANEPPRAELKEQRPDWKPRQGPSGGASRDDRRDEEGRPPGP